MKLIITRHGETEENKLDILQGHLPGKLSSEGIIQAKKVAERLRDEKIDYIYSSDLARSSDTAKEIARFHPNIPIEFVSELREKNMGAWEGKSRKELGLDSTPRANWVFPKDCETSEEIFNRANNFFQKILLKHSKEIILLVGHSAINRALIAVITNKSASEIKLIEHPHNTSIFVFEINENKNHTIHVFNCIKHLE